MDQELIRSVLLLTDEKILKAKYPPETLLEHQVYCNDQGWVVARLHKSSVSGKLVTNRCDIFELTPAGRDKLRLFDES